MTQLKDKHKKDKKELTDKIVSLETENKNLFDKIRLK